MKSVEIQVDDKGLLKLPPGVSIPADARLAVLVFEPSDELNGLAISSLAQRSGAFDFLREEPEVYNDRDILPGRENPRFRK